jgi:glyoxylase-like metal-dependent hydrolase (beta-lactamase superfamily II)
MSQAAGSRPIDRRTLLKGAGAISAVSLLPFTARAQTGAAEVTRLNDRLCVISGLGGNILVAADGADVLVVDSGRAEHASTVVEIIAAQTAGKPVTLLFNSHWHHDQIGANGAIHQQGGEIVAHAKTRARLATPYYLPAEDRYEPARPREDWPTWTFHEAGATSFGQSTVHYAYLLEAHTDGDIYVRFVRDNVIAVGDTIAPTRDPELDWFGGGWLGGRIDALETLLAMSDGQTRFVPGVGPVVDRAYVAAEHELMLGLYDILFARIRAGETAADIFASGALDGLPRQFDDPAKLLYDAHKSMWAHYNTLSPDIV